MDADSLVYVVMPRNERQGSSVSRFLRGVVSVVVALTLLLLFTSCPSHYPGMPMITLGGKVTLEDGTPLEGVAITIVWPEIDQEVTVETNSVGLYRWDYAEMTGDWRVTLTPWHSDYDFLPPEYDLPREHGDNVSLDFTAMPHSPDTVA